MLILYGDSDRVTTKVWNGKRVWTTGLKTPDEVIRTYMDQCILVASKVSDLKEDMEGIYVINEGGHDVSEEAVLRGAYCLKCSMSEGLWRLKDVV